jgi:hypothetical protein
VVWPPFLILPLCVGARATSFKTIAATTHGSSYCPTGPVTVIEAMDS